jgi:macrodomain Ter protein organizer (MatP/YcbG family)
MSKEVPKKMTGIYMDMDVWNRVKREATKEGRSFSNHLNTLLRENPKIKYKRVNTSKLAQEIVDLFEAGTPEKQQVQTLIEERFEVA